MHVPQFIREHGELGVYTEQPIEAFHVQHKIVSRVYAGTNPPKAQAEKIFRRLITNAAIRELEAMEHEDLFPSESEDDEEDQDERCIC